jgi:hypothetical protein
MDTQEPTLAQRISELFKLVTIIIRLLKGKSKTKEYFVMISIAKQLLFLANCTDGDMGVAKECIRDSLDAFQKSVDIAFNDEMPESTDTSKKVFLN